MDGKVFSIDGIQRERKRERERKKKDRERYHSASHPNSSLPTHVCLSQFYQQNVN